MSLAWNSPSDHELQGPPSDCISHVAFSPRGSPKVLFGCTSWDKTVRVWELQQGNMSGVISNPLGMQQHQFPLLGMSISKQGQVFYGGTCKTVMMWNLATNQTQQVAAHQLPVSAVRYVDENVAAPMLITAGWDGKVHFWDLRSSQPAKTEDFRAPIIDFDTSNTTAPLCTFIQGRKAIVYNLQQMVVHGQQDPHQGVKFMYNCVSNLEGSKGFVVGSACGRIAVHPVTPASSSTTLRAHVIENAPAKSLQAFQVNCVSSVKGTVVSGGGDGIGKVWALANKSRLFEWRRFQNPSVPVSAGAIGLDGSLFGYACSYDWSLGKDGYQQNAPKGVFVIPMKSEWIRPL